MRCSRASWPSSAKTAAGPSTHVRPSGKKIKAKLKASFPFALELLEGDCQSLLAADFLSKWPDLASLQRAGAATIRRFFYARNCRRMDRIEPLLAKLKTAKPLTTDEAVIIPSALVLRTLAAQLRVLLPFLAQYDKVLRSTFDPHPDADLFRSVPGAGETMAPRLLTAFGSDRARFANAETVSSFSGIAPVTRSSGKSLTHHLRYACAKFLRQSFHEFAAASIPHCAWAKAFRNCQRARNKGHHTAVRALAYKWIRILYACWKSRTPYSESLYVQSLKNRLAPIAKCL
jgi:transposase